MFLNAMSHEPGDYSGEALTFLGLFDEVTPVTAGDRCTIVDWFTV
jgi:predicted 2-oxoglutarate/Fe(II)-dependent dioxygenase YbiX